jgi:hypothetical protein
MFFVVCRHFVAECACSLPHSNSTRERFSDGGLDLPYVLVTIRIRTQVAIQVKKLAKAFGWQLADFQRTLICIGAVFFFLTVKNKEAQEVVGRLLGGLELLSLSHSFSIRPSWRERPYAFRLRGLKTELTTLSLPKTVSELVGILRA